MATERKQPARENPPDSLRLVAPGLASALCPWWAKQNTVSAAAGRLPFLRTLKTFHARCSHSANRFIPCGARRGWDVVESSRYLKKSLQMRLGIDARIEPALLTTTPAGRIKKQAGMRYANRIVQRLTLAALKQPNSSSVPTPNETLPMVADPDWIVHRPCSGIGRLGSGPECWFHQRPGQGCRRRPVPRRDRLADCPAGGVRHG